MATSSEYKQQQDALYARAQELRSQGGGINEARADVMQQQADALTQEIERLNLQEKGSSTTSQVKNLIGQMQAPSNAPALDPYNEKRLKALESEAEDRPLIEDPLFQGQRAQLVQGGQQALASIQNQQKAQGISGGFSNVGSISDIYDRLSGQLSQLGQQAIKAREEKRDIVARERQGMADLQRQYSDSQIQFENARREALMAAERGDYEMAMQMYQIAEQSRQQMAAIEAQDRAANKQMIGSIVGGLTGAAGSIIGQSWANTKKNG